MRIFRHCVERTLYVTAISLVIVFSYILTVTALKSADIRNHLGTRTPYRFKYNKNDSEISFPNCRDTKIWMMIRHGTRLPNRKDIVYANTKLKDLKLNIILHNRNGKGRSKCKHPPVRVLSKSIQPCRDYPVIFKVHPIKQIPGPLNREQLQWFENWNKVISLVQEKYLTIEGQEEMILLAERMQKRFPNAIPNKYSNETFMFKYTATQRAQQSARYFTIGLFDKNKSQEVYFEPALDVDTTLQFHRHCDRWQKQVKNNPDTYKEVTLFSNSKVMNDTLLRVSKRLGLNKAVTLDEAFIMYRMCGYETAWHKYASSPWCLGFDEESIRVLEYYEDLKKYWLDGHAQSQHFACILLKNMFHSLSERGRNATFLFSHVDTILKLLTHLRLYKPESHMKWDEVDEERPWRTSDIGCFATNIAFVLYKCEDGDKILTLHQERVIKLPNCRSELCPLAELHNNYHSSIHNCDFTDTCSVD